MPHQLQTQRQFHHQTVQIIKSACLGIGSYGAVYEAICNELMCAAKILHPTLFKTKDPGSQKIIERFDQECELLSGIRHPNIVQYLGVSRDPESGLSVLLMELLDGNLTYFLEQSHVPLPYHIQVSLCFDVALALTYLHSNGIIHRDLSSNNILLTAGSRAKVTDFGMSKFTSANPRMTSLTMCPGTMVYMSPEALKEPPVYTEKLDCFSHGVLCIQIVTRQFPNPRQRTKTVPSPQSPTGRIEIPVLDTERRKSHIDQIDPNHPLLPVATDCLSYDEEDRPSAQQLCHHLAALQQTPQYGESVQQTQERNRPAQDTDREERERRIRELQQQQKEQVMEMQNLHLQIQALNQLQSKDQELQAPPKHSQKSSRYPDDASSPVYGNVDHPPIPPRHSRSVYTPRQPSVPPIHPRTRNADNGQPSRRKKPSRSSPTDRRAYFSKAFNGCPLHLNCASSWYHPITKLQYILLGAEEGLFSLLITNNPDPVMEQVSSRPCHWLRVVENALIWLSGHSRFVSMTNLILLFQTKSQKVSLQHSYANHPVMLIPDSKDCYKCCISCNPFTDQRYLIAAVPKGILLMQWYQPKHAFMHVMLFECHIPQPVHMIATLIQEDEEYPIVCFGVNESLDGRLVFNTLNLNSQASQFVDKPEGKELPVLCVQQLEKDTIFVGLDRCAKFVDHNGILKPSSAHTSQLTFERKSDHMVFLSNCVLSFHKHGMQGKSLVTQQVTAEVADEAKVFHLLGSHGTIVIETRPSDDPTAPSNIYILVSEDSQQS